MARKDSPKAGSGAKDHGPHDDPSEAPTLPPPPPLSIIRIKVGVSADELVYRCAMGDIRGAVDVGVALLDEEPVPVLVVSSLMTYPLLSPNAETLLSYVDGKATLAEVFERSGLAFVDALKAVCELLGEEVIALI